MQKMTTAGNKTKALPVPVTKAKVPGRKTNEAKKSLPEARLSSSANADQKTGTLSVRITPLLKKKTTAILSDLGLSYSEAITLFLSQVALHHGLPFEVKIPNATTAKSLRNLRAGKNTEQYDTVDDVMKAILK